MWFLTTNYKQKVSQIPTFDGYNYKYSGMSSTWNKIENGNLIYQSSLLNSQQKSLLVSQNTNQFLHEFEIETNKINPKIIVLFEQNDSLIIRTSRSLGWKMVNSIKLSELKRNPLNAFIKKDSVLQELKIVEIFQTKDKDLIKYFVSPSDIYIKLLKDKSKLTEKTKEENNWILDSKDLLEIENNWYYKLFE